MNEILTFDTKNGFIWATHSSRDPYTIIYVRKVLLGVIAKRYDVGILTYE